MKKKYVIKDIAKRIKMLRHVKRVLYKWRAKFFLKFNPKVIANHPYKSIFGKNINWKNPKDLIEKIQWLQLYTDTSLWTLCADKYLVRDFVEKNGYKEVLNELYGKWDNAEDIHWSILPNSFVLKANHSCGQVKLVKDKSNLNIKDTTSELNRWMKSVFGYDSAQMHYLRIKPCIIAEKLFVNKNEPDRSLIDYKILCFHGEPESWLIGYNRGDGSVSFSVYDMEWNNISDIALKRGGSSFGGIEIIKPSSFDKMVEVAKVLSKDIPQVRVDFYDIDDKAVFGEMTFTTGYSFYTESYLIYLGSKIDLNKVKKLPKPNTI